MTRKETKKNMMAAYADMKEDLRREKESTKYFNRDFLDAFTDWQISVAFNDADDDKKLEKVFSTDFYNKNSCGYCVFLEVFYDRFKKAA